MTRPHPGSHGGGGAARAALHRRRLLVTISTVAYLIINLWATRNLILTKTDLSRFASVPSVEVVPDWPSRIFDQIAAYYYEPVAVIYVTNHLQILVSPPNIGMGLVLGLLVGTNVALAVQVFHAVTSCRRRAFTGLLGAVPGFLTGFACCVPTLALVLGAQATALIVTARSWFFPFALAALTLSLAWNARRLSSFEQGKVDLRRPDNEEPASGRATSERHSPVEARIP